MIEVTVNKKQAKYFEIDAGGTKFFYITIDAEGIVTKSKFNFEKECWE